MGIVFRQRKINTLCVSKLSRNYSTFTDIQSGKKLATWRLHISTNRQSLSERTNELRYSLRFNSLIPPSSVGDMRLLMYGENPLTKLSNKLIVKQSYMLLTWTAYIHNNTLELEKGAHRPSFASLPLQRTRFTITKAPMAHKTFSQEQYQFQVHSVVIKFTSRLNSDELPVNSINESIFLALSLRQMRFAEKLGTNLFLLARVRFTYPTMDPKFFTLK